VFPLNKTGGTLPLNSNLDIDLPIQALMSAMLDRGHHLTLGGAVARQLVRDHDTRGPAPLFQQLAEQALGGLLVPPALDENVEHDPIRACRKVREWVWNWLAGAALHTGHTRAASLKAS
jgi:hypothetical protein